MDDKGQIKKQFKVMIVEDVENVALAIKTIVGKHFECEEVITAKDGQEAWDMLKTGDYDLVISDWNMPRKTGDELLLDMRENDKTMNIPFIMLTARADKDSVITAIQGGSTAYITKPFEKEILIEKIRKLVGHIIPAKDIAGEKSVQTPVIKENEEESDKGNIIKDIVRRFKSGDIDLPVLPNISFKIEKMLRNSKIVLADLAKIIEMDPTITSKLINISNSPYYRGLDKNKTLEKAIIRLGIEETKNYVFVISNRNLFNSEDPMFEEILGKLWEHSLATGGCARIMAARLGLPNPEGFFTMGLLHDIGKLLLIKILMEIARERTDIDRASIDEALDSLHAQFGATLLSSWMFPDEFQQISLYHNELSKADAITKELIVVHFSNLLVRKLGFSMKEDDGTDLTDIESAGLLNLNHETISSISNEVHDHVKEIKNMILR